MEKLIHELETKLKTKLNKNSIYFKSEGSVDLKEYEIAFEKYAILQKTNLKALSDNEVYISIMYETNTDKDEGIVRIPISALAVLLVSKKIVAINVKTDRPDKDINSLILRT